MHPYSPSTCSDGSAATRFSSKYVVTTRPPRLVKPDSQSASRNGKHPGGTVVLNTTSAPLELILSTVSPQSASSRGKYSSPTISPPLAEATSWAFLFSTCGQM